MMTRGPTRQRLLAGSWFALIVAGATLVAGTTFGMFSNSEAQGANTFSGAIFSSSTAPTPSAVIQTPGSNSVLLTWSPVTLSDTSNSGTIEYTVLRSDNTIACSLVATTSCTDTTGTGGANYTYTVTVFYVVIPTGTWSLGPSAASNQITFPETPSFTTTLVQPAQSTVGNSWSDFATVSGDANGGAPTGPVTFTFCTEITPGTPCTVGTTVATVSAPTGTAGDVSTYTPSDTETPTVGNYCFNASYGATTGGAYSSVSQQTDHECFTVSPAAPSSFVTNLAQPNSTTLGNSWNDSAVVTGNATGGPPTGSVTFTFCTESSPPNSPCTGGSTIDTISSPTTVGDASTFTLTSGDAQMPTSTGTYCYNASYTATTGGNYTSVTRQTDDECFSVTAATPTNNVTNSTPITLGSSVTFTTTVTGPGGVTQPTGGTVGWTVSGSAGITSCTTSSTTTLNGSGKATCVLTVANAGTYVVSDNWGGNSNYTTSSGSETITVVAAAPTSNIVTNSTPTTLGSSVTFTATVSGPAGATAPTGGTVTWTVSGSAGINSCTTSSTLTLNGSSQATCVLTVAKAGTYIVSDNWSGNTNYTALASATDTVTVAAVAPTSNIVTNSTPITQGSNVTFTTTVAGPAGATAPTGGIVGWTVSGSAGITTCNVSSTLTLNASSKATCVITVSNAGTYIVSDSWGGNTNYTGPSTGSDTITVVGNHLVFTTAAGSVPTSATPNLGPITVQRQDGAGNPLTPGTALTVNLSSSPSSGATFGTSQFGSALTSVTIPSGQSSVSFWYGLTTSGTPTITASATGFTSASQTETINSTAPTGLSLTNITDSGGTITCANPVADVTSCTGSVSSGGSFTAKVDFVDSSSSPVVYSTTQSSSIAGLAGLHGGVTGFPLTVLAGGTTSTATFTESAPGGSGTEATITFGPYTININVTS